MDFTVSPGHGWQCVLEVPTNQTGRVNLGAFLGKSIDALRLLIRLSHTKQRIASEVQEER
jgi:hypothetical protein